MCTILCRLQCYIFQLHTSFCDLYFQIRKGTSRIVKLSDSLSVAGETISIKCLSSIEVRADSQNDMGTRKTSIPNFMLKLKIFATCFSLLWILSCSESKLLPPDNSIDFSTALESYNKTKNPSQHEGIIVDGTIRIIKYAKGNDRKLVFLVTGTDVYRKYQFQYDAAQVEANLPEVIRNGQTVYLGDNLIIFDAETQKHYSFLVEGYKNRVPQITPKLGIGLISIVFDNGKALEKATASCSCDCQQCSNCDWNCGNSTAQCSCGGNSQSITCRTCYNAKCTACSGE